MHFISKFIVRFCGLLTVKVRASFVVFSGFSFRALFMLGLYLVSFIGPLLGL